MNGEFITQEYNKKGVKYKILQSDRAKNSPALQHLQVYKIFFIQYLHSIFIISFNLHLISIQISLFSQFPFLSAATAAAHLAAPVSSTKTYYGKQRARAT